MTNNINKSYNEIPSRRNKNFYVVGVGASAGGLEAIHELFDFFPNDSNLSFIIVQHLSSDYKSLLAELIAKHTKMIVTEAIDKVPVLPNHIYVIPSRKLITIKDGRLRLSEKRDGAVPNNAIDFLLESLADEMGDHAIGVILSGTGSDGTKGLEAIKRVDGFTIVQEPSSAKFDGMPTSAIGSGVADVIATPQQIPEIIMRFVNKGVKINEKTGLKEKIEPSTVKSILDLVKNRTQKDFSHYKKPTIHRRIEKRMVEANIQNLDDYYTYLTVSSDEVDKLSKDFLIGVTKFFRDKEAFEVFEEKVIPEICDGKEENDNIKVWVAACSMGEEAYSIAILLQEYLQKTKRALNIKIFASDIDRQAIDIASKGRYPLSIAKDISEERLEKFFTKEKDYYCINADLRKMVIFSQHDVTRDPPFSKMDLITCRNMLIYLDPYLQARVLTSFNFSLNVEGYLFLGSSENLGELKNEFLEIDKKNKIYKKIHPTSKSNRHLSNSLNYKTPVISPLANYKGANGKPRITDIFAETMSEELGTAGIIIDTSYNIIQGIGNYHKFLHLPKKDLSFNLIKMVPEDLGYVLTSGIRKALNQRKKVHTKIRIRTEEKSQIICATIKPIFDSHDSQSLLFILLKEEKEKEKNNVSAKVEYEDKTSVNSTIIEQLEDELQETRQNLQTVVEELETSNEELQSSNEELISANEELQSTNEELQSLNEELHTVNTEHQLKIKELIELNDDLNNYFRSSGIGQIYLDSNLVIRKFTPTTKDLINLIDTDIGRPLANISNNIKDENILYDLKNLINTREVVEREIELKNGKFYLTRIFPYIRQDKRTDGVVITFVDITDLKNLNSLLSAVLNSSTNGIMALRPVYGKGKHIADFEFITINNAMEKLLGSQNMLGKKLLETLPVFKEKGLFEKYVKVQEKGEILHEEYQYSRGNDTFWVESVCVKMDLGIAVTISDINESKIAEERSKIAYEDLKNVEESLIHLNNELEERVEERTKELAQSEERLRLVSQATNDVIWDWNLVTNQMWWNEGFKKIFGNDEKPLTSKLDSWSGRIHPDDHERIISSINNAINYGSRLWTAEYKFKKADGTYAYILDRGEILHDENGVPYRMLGSMIDLTESKKAEEAIYTKNRELIKINELLDTFVYTAAHDLKSPVANLKILVDLIKEKGESARKDLLNAIDLSVKRLDNTINGLVEIVEARSVDTKKIKRIYFKELIDGILDEHKSHLMQIQAEVTCDFSKANSIVYIEAYLFSITNNLISNAIKYASKDHKLKIHMETYHQDDFLVFKIEDNGIGMDLQKYGKNLFKPFNRFAKHIEGTGIGLHLIKNMVENNDGRIEVDSKLNEGATFTVYLREYHLEKEITSTNAKPHYKTF